jgi:hypothetical protein
MQKRQNLEHYAIHAHGNLPGKLQGPCLMYIEDVRGLRLRPHGLYVNLVVRREYSSPDHSGSTSTTPLRRHLLGVRLPRLLTSTSLNQKTSRGRLPQHQQLVGSTVD